MFQSPPRSSVHALAGEQAVCAVKLVVPSVDLDVNELQWDEQPPVLNYLLDGLMQYIATDSDFYVPAEKLLSPAPIALFDPARSDNLPIGPGQRWMRTDIALHHLRVAGAVTMYKVPSVRVSVPVTAVFTLTFFSQLPLRMCRVSASKCQYAGQYDPVRHTTIYCPDCDRWYHVQCIDALGTAMFVQQHGQSELPAHITDALADADIPVRLRNRSQALWHKVRSLPVQRRQLDLPPAFINCPLSFEYTILRARLLDEQPDDVTKWIAQTVKESFPASRPRKYITSARGLLNTLLAAPIRDQPMYRCPRSHVL